MLGGDATRTVGTLHAEQARSSHGVEESGETDGEVAGSFKELVQTRVNGKSQQMNNVKKVTVGSGNVFADLGFANPKKFAEALLREGIDAMLGGDVETGKTILRDYIKATVGFEKLGEATGTQPKSLIRMFGPRGNPQAKNLFSVLGYLQKRAGLELHVA